MPRRSSSLAHVKALRPPLALAALATTIFVITSARAQVMEIGKGGAVSVYNGPMVFTDAGAAPIATKPAARPVARKVRVDRAAIAKAAAATGLSPDLLEAVAWRESGFRASALSRKGAIGQMQLMPATARAMGVDPQLNDQNLKGGAAYLTVMMRRYDGDLVRALAAYNAGPGAVDRYGGAPPYKETQAYVAAIMDRLSQIADHGATGLSR